MKKVFLIIPASIFGLALLYLLFLFLLFPPANSIDTGYLRIAKAGEDLYVETTRSQVCRLNLADKSYVSVAEGEVPALLWEEKEAFDYRFFAGEYLYTVPADFEAVVSHIEAYRLENEHSVVAAAGYVDDGVLYGFVQVYKEAPDGNYAVEKIDHSLTFSYCAETEAFTVHARFDGAVVVAVRDASVIYWKDKAYYAYDGKRQREIRLVEDKAYDGGLRRQSSSGVYANSDICVLCMTKALPAKDREYLYVYRWETGEFCGLAVEKE